MVLWLREKKNRNTNHPHTGSRSNRIKKLHKTSFGGANLCTIDTSETVFRSQRNSIKRQRKDNIIFDLFAHTYILYACVCNYRIHPKRHWFSSSSTNFCMLYRVYTTHNSLARFFDLRIPTQMQKTRGAPARNHKAGRSRFNEKCVFGRNNMPIWSTVLKIP